MEIIQFPVNFFAGGNKRDERIHTIPADLIHLTWETGIS